MRQIVLETKAQPDRGVVLTKAVLGAAERLGMKAKTLGEIVGVSEATVSRMKRGDFVLEDGAKSFELAALLVRVFRSLDAIVGGDERVARAWLVNANAALGGTPLDRMRSITGLTDVIAYLEPRPLQRQTWRIRISPRGAQALSEHPKARLEFIPEQFADDPRIAGTAWEETRGA